MKVIAVLGLVVGLAVGMAAVAAPAPQTTPNSTTPDSAAPAPPGQSVADVASLTFVRACVVHFGALDELRAKLQPGREMYLPRLPAKESQSFLQGRAGEVYVRPDAGVSLLLLDDGQCAVFVRQVATERMAQRLEADLRVAAGKAFTVKAAGREAKGAMQSRFFDMVPAGEYREDMRKKLGSDPLAWRVILTTSETANPGLQAIISIGTR